MSELRVLLVDDSEDEAFLLEDEFRQNGYVPFLRRVDTPEAMLAALTEDHWDVLLVDYFMPRFSAPAALQLYREIGHDIPCLILSGQITDKTAVEMMRSGARDFIPKDQRARLLPAITREVEEARQRRERYEAEHALVESERRHAMIFAGAEISIWEEDFSALYAHLNALRRRGVEDLRSYLETHPAAVRHCLSLIRIIDVNPATLRLLAVADKNHLLASLDNVFTDATLAVFAEQLCAIWEQQPVFRAEAPLCRLDGKEIVVMVSMPVPQTAAGFRYVPLSLTDITDYKRSREAEAHIAHQNQLVLDTAGEGIFGLDREGRHTFINHTAAALLGYTPEELIGRHSHSTWHHHRPDGSEFPAPDCPIYAVLKNGRPHEGEEYFIRKDGSLFAVEFVSTPLVENDQVAGAVVSFRDISARKQAETALLRTNRALNTLSACNQLLIHAEDETTLLREICHVLENTGGYPVAWVGTTGGGTCYLEPRAWGGNDLDFIHLLAEQNRLTATEQTPALTALLNGRPCVVEDVAQWQGAERWQRETLAAGYHACMALPLRENGNTLGVLLVYVKEAVAFLPKEADLLEELADDIAFGIRTVRTRQERDKMRVSLNLSLMQTVEAIATTVEKRDPYTAGHQQRVGELAAKIAQEIGLIEEQTEGVRLGGSIHDIGKIYIPAEILNRPGRLTEVEFSLIKTHSQVGYDIIKNITFPWPLAQMILQHHERLDGSGYPHGLQGREIILEARILAVADVVESINSHRPYRPALGIDEALNEIETGAGTRYDAQIVEACKSLIMRKGLPW